MKLRDLRLCVQCDEAFEAHYRTDINGGKISLDFSCPSCGCSATFPVCQWLPTLEENNRQKKEINYA